VHLAREVKGPPIDGAARPFSWAAERRTVPDVRQLGGRVLLIGGLISGAAACALPSPEVDGPIFGAVSATAGGCRAGARELQLSAEVTSAVGVSSVGFAWDDGDSIGGMRAPAAAGAPWTGTVLIVDVPVVIEVRFVATDRLGRRASVDVPPLELPACD
jgi:hypothetical protein